MNDKHPIRVDLVVYATLVVALVLALASLSPATSGNLGIISALLGFVGGVLGAYIVGKNGRKGADKNNTEKK